MVLIDATVLMLWVDPGAKPPNDPGTGAPVEKSKERIDNLIRTLDKAKTRILVPTPALSEVLVGHTPSQIADIVEMLSTSSVFVIGEFDALAAIEVATLTDSDLVSGRTLSPTETKAKVKYDRQIIAIAKVAGCSLIYSDDAGLAATARRNGIEVYGTHELPLPPVDAQSDFFAS